MAPAKQPPPDARPSLRERLRAVRGWIAAHRLRAALIGGGSGLLLACLVLGGISFLMPRDGGEEDVTLEMIYAALDARALVETGELVDKLRKHEDLSPEQLAALAFARGAALAYETDETWAPDKTPSYLLAARYLEEARDRGFPEGRKAEGLWLLARCLYLSGQYPSSRLALHEALPLHPRRSAAIHRMLAGAYLRDANPDLKHALEHNTLLLAEKRLTKEERLEGQLERAQILFRLGRLDDCRELLIEVPHDTPLYGEVILMRGRIALEEARAIKKNPQHVGAGDAVQQAQPKYERAIELFRQAQGLDTLASNTTRKAMYLIGVCYAETGKLPAAYEQLERTRKLYYESPEGLAASLWAADLLRLLQRHDEAVNAYLRTFEAAGNPRSFSNPWLTLDQFRLRMLAAYQAYFDAEQYEQALLLLQRFRPMFSPYRAAELTGQTQRGWADWLARQAAQEPEFAARKTRREAGVHYRRAGHTFARLARMRIATRSYPEDLWNSADNLLRGQDYKNATLILQEYLKNESRKRRPLALVGLGKAKLATGDIEASVRAFNECIEFHPRDAAVYDARFWCAKAHIELGETAKAEQLLLTNLRGDTLTPASLEWRESLFALGRLLHAAERYEEAIRYLEEAVARYPDDDQALEGYYLIGECYRHAALVPQARLREATIENVRLDQRREIKRLLEAALRNYSHAQKELNLRTEQNHLTELQSAILRNCYFFVASVQFDLGRYEEAIKAYSDASTRYQHEPIVLEALLQIANCHRRLQRPVEARGALAQAKVVWKRLPENADFLLTTNYSRDEWSALLDQLSAW